MHTRTRVLLAALCTLLALGFAGYEPSASVRAQDAPVAGPDAPPAPPAPEKPAAPKPVEPPEAIEKEVKREVARIFALKAMGSRLGTSTTTVRWFDDDSLEMISDQLIRVERTMGEMKDFFEMSAKSSEWYDAKGVMTGSFTIRTDAGVEIRDRTDIAEGTLRHRHSGPGVNKDDEHELPEKYKSRESAYRALIDAWKTDPTKKTLAYVDWDTMRHSFERNTLTVIGAAEVERAGEKHKGTRISHRTRDGVLEFILDSEMLPIGGKVLGFIDLEWMPDDDVFVAGNPVSLSAIIDANVHISSWRNIESISLVLDIEGDTDEEEFLPTNGYQTVTREGTKRTIELKQQRIPSGHKAPALPIADVPEDVAVFLKPTPMSQSDDEAIKAKATAIADGKTDSAAVTRSIVRWVFRNIKKQSGARGAASAVEVLKDLEGDCTEHAVLSVALLRAAGIPARAASGLVYAPMGTDTSVWGFHAWAEAWIGTWIPIDATVNEVGLAARFIHFGHDEPTTDGGTVGITRALGKTAITITAYKVRDHDKVLVPEKAADQKPAEAAGPGPQSAPVSKDERPAAPSETPTPPGSDPKPSESEPLAFRLITGGQSLTSAA